MCFDWFYSECIVLDLITCVDLFGVLAFFFVVQLVVFGFVDYVWWIVFDDCDCGVSWCYA